MLAPQNGDQFGNFKHKTLLKYVKSYIKQI